MIEKLIFLLVSRFRFVGFGMFVKLLLIIMNTQILKRISYDCAVSVNRN